MTTSLEGYDADFVALIPARMASTRLPGKPLADIAGLPMVVRVAQRAAASGARRCIVATESKAVLKACENHGIEALLTREDHASGSDRLAEACDRLALPDTTIVVNVQGDEPLLDPALVGAVADTLRQRDDCVMASAAYPINTLEEFLNPNVVKVVMDRQQTALYFSRAPIPWRRDGAANVEAETLPTPVPWRHVGLYAYRAGFLRRFPSLPMAPSERIEALEQLRVLWHGGRIAMTLATGAPGPGVDTPEDLEKVRQMVQVGL